MIKKIVSVLLVIFMIVTLLPKSETATAATTYSIWVGNTQVTDTNMQDVLGDGTVSYTPATKDVPQILVLNGANITNVWQDTDNGYMYRAGIYSNKDLNLVLEGNNTIGGSSNYNNSDYSYGVYIKLNNIPLKLNISGTGSLTVIAGQAYYVSAGVEMNTDSTLEISDATVSVIGSHAAFSYGIGIVNTLTMNSGSLTAIGGTPSGGNSNGIYYPKMIINGGTVTLIGNSKAKTNSTNTINYPSIYIAGTNVDGSNRGIVDETTFKTNFSNYKYIRIMPDNSLSANLVPHVEIDYKNEHLIGFNEGNYSFNGGTEVAVSGNSYPINSSWMDSTISIVHRGDFTATSDSLAQSLTIPARPEQLAAVHYKVQSESKEDKNDAKFMLKESAPSGEYEYSKDGGSSWINLSNEEWITNLEPGNYLLRLKATDSAFAGETATLRLNEGTPIPRLTIAEILFDPITEGESNTVAKPIPIMNSGRAEATISSVTVSPTSAFEIVGSGASVPANNGSISTWTVQPKSELAVGTYTANITVTYDDGATATREIVLEVNAPVTYTIGATAGTGGDITPSGNVVVIGGENQTFNITPSSNYSIADVKVDNISQGNISSYTFEEVTTNHTISATFSYNGDDSGNPGDSGNPDNSANNIIVALPTEDNPNSPVEGEMEIASIVESDGNVVVNITDEAIYNIYNKIMTEAKNKGFEHNPITVAFRVNTSDNSGTYITVHMPKIVQDIIIEKKIGNIIVVVDNPHIQIDMDLATVQEIRKQAQSDVSITASPTNRDQLSSEALRATDSRPVYDINVNYGEGETVSSFGTGTVFITMPYKLGTYEKADNVQAIYIDDEGKVHWLANSVYNSTEKVLRFSTNHFSMFGIGYKQVRYTFTDISDSWAKDDIEFVVSRALMEGTSTTTFSPNTAMTRGMFVTVLSRLAEVDISKYATSSFDDVEADSIYLGGIEWAKENHITNGIGDRKFASSNFITREQMAVMTVNYASLIGYSLKEIYEENSFVDDAEINSYAKQAVKQLQMAGVIGGKESNIFDPRGTSTRAEVSTVLKRFIDLVNMHYDMPIK